MHSICFQLGPLTIRWYGVMMALGFLAGLLNWVVQGKKDGRDLNYCMDLLFWVMISGIIGARLAYVASDFSYYMANPLQIIRIDRGGLIFYGGFIAAIVVLVVFAKKHNERLLAFFDFAVTSVPLAHIFGRIGCFLNGCCYGKVTDLPIAVHFPKNSLPWVDQLYSGLITHFDSVSKGIHPVQLYESACNLVLFVVLAIAYRYKKKDGSVTAAYLMLYAFVRYYLEDFRGTPRVWAYGSSVAQIVSLFLFVAGAVLAFYVMRQNGKEVTDKDIS